MTQTIIEIFYDTDSNGDLILKGDPDEDAYQDLKPYLTAVEHNMNNGVASTLYRVDDDAPSSAIQAMVDTAPEHFDHGIDGGIVRGLEIQPGTPTQQEADDLAQRISDAGGLDITSAQPNFEPAVHIQNDLPNDALDSAEPSWSQSTDQGAGGGTVASDHAPSKTVVEVVKNDFPSIGEGKWRCTHPDHDSPEMNDEGTTCSLGHSDEVVENEYAQPHRQPFDPTDFL